ncbi:VOC family protein [Novosphingobium colocasiae]
MHQPEDRKRRPRKNLRYGHTGIHELGLLVEGIDGWFEKIKAAGYRMQTDYVWQCAEIGRSFIFYDQDGNMIQIWENMGQPEWS